MYSAQPNGVDSATVDPATLASSNLLLSPSPGVKTKRSPTVYQTQPPTSAGHDAEPNVTNRPRSMKSNQPAPVSQSPVQASAPMQQSIPPQTPQSQTAPLPGPQPAYTPSQASASSPPKPTPKSTLKALPTVRDHTTDQLGPGGDEYLPREIDENGEKKVNANGTLNGDRVFRCRTFLVPNRGDKYFMLATECARVLGYRDSYLLFNKNRSLFKIIANQAEKDDLVSQEILPFSYRSRQIAIVTARSMFRQFGSRVIVNGRRVRDDYWETKARKQGFTEADLAGEKRPGAAKAREAAAAAEQNASLLGGPQGEIVYSNTPAQFGGAPHPQLIQPGMLGAPSTGSLRMPALTIPDYPDTRRTDYSSILKTGPRQEITGPPYQDRTQPSPMPEIHAQAHHAAEFNRSVNQQREMRSDWTNNMWRRPHEQPASANISQPQQPQQPVTVGAADASIPTSRAAQSPHATSSALSQQQQQQQQHAGMVPNQSPLLMSAPPYSTPIQAQNPISQSSSIRGMAPIKQNQSSPQPTRLVSSTGSTGSSLPQSGYAYQPSNQMWPPTPQTPQYGYTHTQQSQQSPHHSQSSAAQIRHSSGSGPVQPGALPYSGMPGMAQGYPAASPYDHQTPRGYMHQGAAPAPAVTQAWSGQQQQPQPQQWWTQPPQ
ncbi:chromatin remodelling complex Rsc7/Swp82 subunit-domain-containing protein [Coniella lustricola]|uniref:Polyadenylation factor subunit 2 n=1 Tax=Coniella lustricola TaxID=2025994 RepID=A0A2T3A3L6_9PEZI|nr:chromatin remodelling complex Rsc7/Swp82 subunit-domain-containing protein [Coniella lustricola]